MPFIFFFRLPPASAPLLTCFCPLSFFQLPFPHSLWLTTVHSFVVCFCFRSSHFLNFSNVLPSLLSSWPSWFLTCPALLFLSLSALFLQFFLDFSLVYPALSCFKLRVSAFDILICTLHSHGLTDLPVGTRFILHHAIHRLTGRGEVVQPMRLSVSGGTLTAHGARNWAEWQPLPWGIRDSRVWLSLRPRSQHAEKHGGAWELLEVPLGVGRGGLAQQDSLQPEYC